MKKNKLDFASLDKKLNLEYDRAAIFFNAQSVDKFFNDPEDLEVTSIDLMFESEGVPEKLERRKSPSKAMNCSLVITRLRDLKTLRGCCRDMSLSGIGIEVFALDFKVGDEVHLEFESLDGSRRFECRAVVRMRQCSIKKSHLGLEITAVTSLSRRNLLSLVNEI